MISIIDYGIGNSGALVNMFDFIGHEALITDQASQILESDYLVLPGVGAFDAAMQCLHNSHLIPALEKAVFERKTPLLGICLGMQLLGRCSEEGKLKGLGWIAADTVRMRPNPASNLKVPFIGWADVEPTDAAKLFDAQIEHRFYFTHSYKMGCDQGSNIAGTYLFDEPVTCAIQSSNIYGVQFHPEKSHRFGMRLLGNFIERSR